MERLQAAVMEQLQVVVMERRATADAAADCIAPGF
jgi:hypothetical protein